MDTSIKSGLTELGFALPDLALEANRRSREFEDARNIAADFVEKLLAIGAYRVLVSEAQGGLGATLSEWFDMMVQLAEADASTAWTCAHGNICSALIANAADERFAAEFFADPKANAAWSNLPRIEVKESEGGLCISGRWGFVSGCTAATWVGGMIQLPPGMKTDKGAYGLVVALAPAAQATIDRTWDPVGLAGSGSHDVVFEDVFIPWEHVFDWPISKANYEYPTRILVSETLNTSSWFISLCVAATHLGLARRAIDESRNELRGKKDRYTGELVQTKPSKLIPLEQAEGLWFACRTGVDQALKEVWACALQGQVLDDSLTMKVHLASLTAVHQGSSIVRSVYDVAGASAIARNGVLQQVLRDASCLTHHISSNTENFLKTGIIRQAQENQN
jgi:alkylation response protein AidB-like acyl-CoA dehydrogenase